LQCLKERIDRSNAHLEQIIYDEPEGAGSVPVPFRPALSLSEEQFMDMLQRSSLNRDIEVIKQQLLKHDGASKEPHSSAATTRPIVKSEGAAALVHVSQSPPSSVGKRLRSSGSASKDAAVPVSSSQALLSPSRRKH